MRDDDWFAEAMDAAFDNPQARLILQREQDAARTAEWNRKQREEDLAASRPHPAAVANAASEFNQVLSGQRPMYTPGRAPLKNKVNYTPAPRSGSTTKPPPPGQTGAISVKMATEAIMNHVRQAKDPRSEASQMLTMLTAELIRIAQENDPETD